MIKRNILKVAEHGKSLGFGGGGRAVVGRWCRRGLRPPQGDSGPFAQGLAAANRAGKWHKRWREQAQECQRLRIGNYEKEKGRRERREKEIKRRRKRHRERKRK